jgi:hypothetical protein
LVERQPDRLFLIGFGTGFRDRSSLSGVNATIGGTIAEVLFAGPQGTYEGLDQANIAIPSSEGGRQNRKYGDAEYQVTLRNFFEKSHPLDGTNQGALEERAVG